MNFCLFVCVCVWGDGLIESSMWVVCLSCFMYANQKLFLSKFFQPTTIHPLPDISVYTVVGYPHNNNNTCTPWIYQETIITAMDSIYTHTHANFIQTQNQHLRSRYYPSNEKQKKKLNESKPTNNSILLDSNPISPPEIIKTRMNHTHTHTYLWTSSSSYIQQIFRRIKKMKILNSLWMNHWMNPEHLDDNYFGITFFSLTLSFFAPFQIHLHHHHHHQTTIKSITKQPSQINQWLKLPHSNAKKRCILSVWRLYC